MENLYKYLPSFSSVGPWLSKKGALYAAITGLIVASFLIKLDCMPSSPADPKSTTLPLWHITYLVGFPVLFVFLWFVGTQNYLNTGAGTKIGLAYDGHAINIADWKRTRTTLRDLLKNGQIKNRVSLRFVPFSSCRTGEHANKYMKRYGFTILTTVRQSPALEQSNIEGDQHPAFTNINLRIVTKAEEKQFLETTLKHSLEIIKKRRAGPALADILDAQAQNLHDMLLLFVASHCFLQKNYKDSNAILRHLDQSLSSMTRPDQSPRSQIRKLAMESCLALTGFSHREIPPLDKLIEIRDFAETALPYFDDSYLVPVSLARIRFLTDDLDGAIELTKRYGEKIEEIKKSGQQLTSRVLPSYFLNLGFLSFVQGHWVNAYNAYHEMLSVDAYRNENWEGIIEFIVYVETLERYEGICYLRTLYRLIAKKEVSAELRAAAHEWVNQDESRKELKTLLSRNYPSLAKKSEEKVGTREQQRKTKQRSKRKKKPRKKKR